ncbi:MAG: hypothetical protein FJ403_10925 [Verrucomicrobia bacterium]|nr:hypothetical protein [Verrucomicrobiota bacterium]
MSSSPENFDNLRRLLACKRYEQPPPGYFNSFSEKVIDRLEAEEFNEYSSWWQWLVDKFDAKPIVACLYGMAVSGLLLAGFRLSQIFETETASAAIPSGPWLAATPGSGAILQGQFGQNSFVDVPAWTVSSSLNSAFRPETSNLLFESSGLRGQTLKFGTSGF